MTKQTIILGIGTGRCGTASLAKILNQQPDMVCSFDEPPLLPWKTGSTPSAEELRPMGERNVAREGNTPSPPAPLPKGEGRFEDGPLAREGNAPSPPAPLPQAGEGSFYDDTVQQAGNTPPAPLPKGEGRFEDEG